MLLLAVGLCVGLALSAGGPRSVSLLKPGEPLTGTVVGAHNDKLFLRTAVYREANGSTAPLTAMLTLPRKSELLREPPVGEELCVRVSRTRGSSDRIVRHKDVFRVELPPPERPPPERLSQRGRDEAAASAPLNLDELTVGQTLTALVVSVRPCGVYVDVPVARRGRRGARRAVTALLPTGELGSRAGTVGELTRGDELELRVMDAQPASGFLVLTTSSAPAADLEAATAARAAARRTRGRRRSVLPAGSVREGIVTRVEKYGALVNVGARHAGLVHVSELAGGGYVDDPNDVVAVGDAVEVEVLESSAGRGKIRGRMALRLRSKLARDGEAVAQAVLATQRRGVAVRETFSRREDAAIRARGAADVSSTAVEAEAEVSSAEAAGEEWEEEENLEDEPEEEDADEEFSESYFEDKYEDEFW